MKMRPRSQLVDDVVKEEEILGNEELIDSDFELII